MQRLRERQGVMVATAIGLVLLGGISYAIAAEDVKKSAEQAAPPAGGKAPATKKAPEKKAAAKSGGPKAKSAATTPKGPAPKYSSAETAAKAQACFGEAPKIESVKPDEGKAGDKVTISGRNFGPAECLRSLSFGPGHPATFKFESDNQITATVPIGRRKGMAMMTVTTASGEDSKPFLVK
ncbi:MAG: IPT/TIG domain-containing protein [Nitrospira defluvii]|nr:IPT/TIG domain-containing protein [Nitrospira defluvii]